MFAPRGLWNIINTSELELSSLEQVWNSYDTSEVRYLNQASDVTLLNFSVIHQNIPFSIQVNGIKEVSIEETSFFLRQQRRQIIPKHVGICSQPVQVVTTQICICYARGDDRLWERFHSAWCRQLHNFRVLYQSSYRRGTWNWIVCCLQFLSNYISV